MDLNAKPPSNTKAAENPKSQPPNWSVELDREINAGLFDTPGGSGCSRSELIHGYTSRSSKSASISSSPNTDNSKPCIFAFETSQDDSNGKIELSKEDIESSHAPELSFVSGEPLLTPKLGKRMYFEAVCPESDSKNLSFSRDLNSSLSIRKKCKSTGQNLQCPPCCQVEGCGLDLSSAKDYYRKHRVCDRHSKSPKVVIDGLERRFCQKCSRFHDLFEFDEKKKSCRRRLLHHNARRRLLHQDDSNGKIELSKEDIESSHAPELSSVSGEQVLTPKLGKRMYFEAVCPESDSKNLSFSRDLNSSLSIPKKCKSTGQNLQCLPRCQVEGCGLDLSSAKDYYRKHRVCDRYSKSLKVVIDGLERRFCQKCSRFRDLFEFDEKKKSCRRRLLHHNARGRLLHQDDSNGKIELSKEDIEISHAPELSSVSGEQVLTPKLGKRMYFEAVCPESDSKNLSFSRDLNSSLSIPKKCKSTGQNLQCPPRCQVEGCGLDLSSAKDYYRKHRVCDRHSKSLKVVIDGLKRRFCQKCSRFHDLFEFDEKKRSCRRRLLHNNARRHIYRPEAVQSSQSALSSSRCHGKQQMSPFAYSRTATSLACQNIHNSKLPQTKDFLLKPAKVNIDTLSIVTTLSDDSRVLATKIINTGVEDFITFSDTNAIQDFTCAPSLLSAKPRDSYETQSISQEHSNSPTSALQAITHAMGEHMPLASSESWHSDHDQYVNSCMWISNSNCEDTNHFLEF